MRAAVKTTIEREGQRYVDEIVFVQPRPRSPIAEAVAAAIGVDDYPRRAIPVGYNRIPLRWAQKGN
jgi:hypothetical protein